MRQRTPRSRLASSPLLVAASLGLCLGPCGMVAAQSPTEAGIRASFLYRFARFTGWPADALLAGAPMRFCVGSPAVAAGLSVSDLPRFTAMGGVASVRVEDGKVRLAINVAIAARANLRIDSRLLNLATVVGDGGVQDAHAGRR